MGRIYGRVEGPEDIRRINCIIRDEMLEVESEGQLTDLKKRSDYLCTLTYSPFWKKRFGPLVEELREVACEENRVSVRLANYVARFRGWDKVYDPWGREDKSLEERLAELPEEAIRETAETAVSLELSPEVLEELRRAFCRIRKAMVVAQDEEELRRLKRAGDLLLATTKTLGFREHFGEELAAIDELVELEERRTVKLANLIAEVQGWRVLFEAWTLDEVPVEEGLEAYLARLEEEEERASRYIPSEAKYPAGRTLWIVYEHEGRKRRYAKRVYVPGYATDFRLEGPGEFENRFGRKVWGVRLVYRSRIAPTTARIRGHLVHLPERWVTRSRVIPLPREARKVELAFERPPEAYDVA